MSEPTRQGGPTPTPSLESKEVSLNSIRRLREQTSRGKEKGEIPKVPQVELGIYVNQATFDLFLRLDLIERNLKGDAKASPEAVLDQIDEIRREVKLITEVADFAIARTV